MNISVFGLGFVISVSAGCLTDTGQEVFGVDINEHQVTLINSGKASVVESGLERKIEEVVKAASLRTATAVQIALIHSKGSFMIMAAPSGQNGEINPDHLYRASGQIADCSKELNRRQIVVIRSTVLPEILEGCRSCSMSGHRVS